MKKKNFEFLENLIVGKKFSRANASQTTQNCILSPDHVLPSRILSPDHVLTSRTLGGISSKFRLLEKTKFSKFQNFDDGGVRDPKQTRNCFIVLDLNNYICVSGVSLNSLTKSLDLYGFH